MERAGRSSFLELIVRLWIALAAIHVAAGTGYWGYRMAADAPGWSLSLDQRRIEIYPNYPAIVQAARLLPETAIVLLEDRTPGDDRDEHFCIYYLYPRRVLATSSPDVTHVVRLGQRDAAVRAVQPPGANP